MDGLVRKVGIDAVHLLRRCLSSPIGAGAVGVMPQAGRARRDHPDRHPGHNPEARAVRDQAVQRRRPIAKRVCSQAFWSATAKNGREFLGKVVRRCCSRQRRSRLTAEASSRPNSKPSAKPGASISGSCRRSRISRTPPERPKCLRELGRGDAGNLQPQKRIIYEQVLQGYCGTNSAEPKTGAHSGERGKRGQSMPRTPNQKTAHKGIVHRLSTLPTNATQTNAPKRPKPRPLENKPPKSYKPSSEADESDPEASQRCRTRTST